MLLVALTGNIASGKSRVAAGLVRRGATLIDSDLAARAAVAPGTPAIAAIEKRFGAEMLLPDGSLDRPRLGRVVFADADARQALEEIVHPAVEATRIAAVTQARRAGALVVVCDIPLLFEVRLAWQFPRVVLVDAAEPVRIARLVTQRGMAPDDAADRVRAQLPSALKRPRADFVIANDGSLEALDVAIDAAWTRLMAWAS